MVSTQTFRTTITHIGRQFEDGFIAVSAIRDEPPGLYWVKRSQLTEFLDPIDLEKALALDPAAEPPESFALAAPMEVLLTGEVGYTAGSAWFTAKSVMPVEEAEADPCEVNAEADGEGERVWDESLFPICMEFEPVIQRIREAVGVLQERPGLESSSTEALARLKHGLRRLPARTPGMDIGVDLSRQTDANGSRGGLFLRLSEDSFDVEYAGYVIGPCGGDSETRRVLSCENSGYRSDEGCDGAEVLIDLEDWAFQFEDCCRDPDVKVEVSDSGDTHALEDVDTEALWNRMPSHY